MMIKIPSSIASRETYINTSKVTTITVEPIYDDGRATNRKSICIYLYGVESRSASGTIEEIDALRDLIIMHTVAS